MKNESVILSGTIAGTIEHYAVLIPRSILDHNQLNKSYFKSNNHIVKEIYTKQGISGFFRGIVPLFGSVSISHIWLYYFYELNKETTSSINSLLYSSLAKIGHDIIMIPGDTIRMRSNISGMNSIELIKDIYKKHRILGFFKSSPVALIMNIPSCIIEFSILKNCIKSFGDETYKIFGYGAFAGIITSVINNPLDIIKTRIQTEGVTNMYSQVQYPFYISYIDVFKTTYKERGIRGLFRGSILRSFQGAIGYGTYEYVSSKLNKK